MGGTGLKSGVWVAVFCAVLCLLLSGQRTEAHRLNETYVYFSVSDTALTGRFEATTSDIQLVIPVDEDGNGEVSLEELEANADEIYKYFAQRLSLWDGDRAVEITPAEIKVLPTPQGDFAQIGFKVLDLAPVPDELGIQYRPLTDAINPEHLGYGLIENNTRTGIVDNEGHVSLVFNASNARQTLHLSGEPLGGVFVDFLRQGIFHIWKGFDHLIFLISLMLPAVMLAGGKKWVPQESFAPAFMNVIKLVTVFTLSHIVAFSIAVFGIVNLPIPLVVTVITLAIVAVALMNMFPAYQKFLIWAVVIFGVFHGLGYANILAPLGMDPSAKWVGIAGFNLGIELGQIAVVLIALPVIWLFRNWSLYPQLAFNFGSICLVLLAGVWYLERATGIIWDLRAVVLQSVGLT